MISQVSIWSWVHFFSVAVCFGTPESLLERHSYDDSGYSSWFMESLVPCCACSCVMLSCFSCILLGSSTNPTGSCEDQERRLKRPWERHCSNLLLKGSIQNSPSFCILMRKKSPGEHTQDLLIYVQTLREWFLGLSYPIYEMASTWRAFLTYQDAIDSIIVIGLQDQFFSPWWYR